MIAAIAIEKRFSAPARGAGRLFGIGRRDSVVAVDGVSFEAADGAVTALLGPNGAGKTTTLRLVTAALVPDAGRVLIDGIDTRTGGVDARARLGLFSDNRGLYPRLSSRENIRYYGELQGLAPRLIESRIDALVVQLEMETIIDRPVEGFSLGQRMKVALARTLIHDPPNVLLDEPTTGLDVMATRALRDLIRKLRNEGKCIILSTHVMQEVAHLADRVIVMTKGKVKANTTCDELLAETGAPSLEEAFLSTIGTGEGLKA